MYRAGSKCSQPFPTALRGHATTHVALSEANSQKLLQGPVRWARLGLATPVLSCCTGTDGSVQQLDGWHLLGGEADIGGRSAWLHIMHPASHAQQDISMQVAASTGQAQKQMSCEADTSRVHGLHASYATEGVPACDQCSRAQIAQI